MNGRRSVAVRRPSVEEPELKKKVKQSSSNRRKTEKALGYNLRQIKAKSFSEFLSESDFDQRDQDFNVQKKHAKKAEVLLDKDVIEYDKLPCKKALLAKLLDQVTAKTAHFKVDWFQE